MNTEKTSVNWYSHGARYYDPQLARWHSSDPLAELYSGFSPYHYAGNNPVNFVDPNGMSYGPSDDERAKINEGGHSGGFGFGPGVRRLQADPYSWNNVGRFMSDPGPGRPYTDENGNTYETGQDPVTGEKYYTVEYETDWFNAATYEFMYTTPGGSERVPIASNDGDGSGPVYGSPESELVTVAGSGASVYKHLPGFMAPIVHKHYTGLNFKGGKLFGKIGKAGDFVSTTGAIINLQNDPSNPEYWADLFFAGVGWFPVLGDMTTTLYTTGKDQVYIRQDNIRNNRNPMHGVYVPVTGDVWFGF